MEVEKAIDPLLPSGPEAAITSNSGRSTTLWAYGVVVSMFDFHRSDRGSNPGRGGKIS